MEEPHEIELVFAPQEEGGYHVHAPDLPGLHTQGDTLAEATTNAEEALELYAAPRRAAHLRVQAGGNVSDLVADQRR